MDFFDSSKSFVENASLLSGPIIAVLGFAGLLQLRLTKKAIIISSKRESAQLATNQIDVYHSQIIPLINELDLAKRTEGISKVKIEPGEFNFQYVQSKLGKETCNNFILERAKILPITLRVLNSLEAFSLYFTKGVADEQIAYSAIGRTYCYTIENLYFDLAWSINDKDDFSFQNIIELYTLWKGRIDKVKLSQQQKDILNKLAGIKEEKLNPIGTK